MSHSIEIITSIDNQIPLLLPTEKDEIEEGRKVHYLIEVKKTNGQDLLGSQTKKSINQSFDEKFEDVNNSSIKSCTIFKVNVGLRESNPDAYTPKMVSIGPYHKKNSQLWQMEKYKVFYLRRFLQRKKELGVESCISELMELKEEALKCYDDIEDLNNDQFLQMLLLDGCFVVEFIRELQEEYPQEEEDLEDPQGDKTIVNTNVACILDQVTRDLMLLENQLPFFVLNKLHDMTKHDKELPFAIMAKCCFAINLPKTTPAALLEIHNNANAGNIKHLLHLIHMSWQGNPNTDPTYSCKILCCNPLQIIRSKEKKNDKGNKVVMPNATELSEAGLSFKSFGNIYRSYDEDDIGDTKLFDIKYENGLLKIPCLRVYDSTESNLRNLIAFEQQSDVHHKYFSDFATFMDHLIESDKDVNLLRQKGIIDNRLGEDKEVTRIFNKIGKGVSTSDGFFINEEYRKIIQHCEKTSKRMMASLMRNYFSSPWVGASTLAAIVLLILTAIQTVLAFTGGVK
ncbi:hypothetical protein P3S68_031083 [Capsicum galapagoense]